LVEVAALIFLYKGGTTSTLSLFAGSDEEDGSTDGPVKESHYKQPVGISASSKVLCMCVTLRQIQ